MTTLADRPARPPAAPVTSRSRRRLAIGTTAIVLVGVVLTWLVAFSSVFGVDTVEVRGNLSLSANTIRHAAAIGSGTPLVRLDTGAIRHRVMALPDVASASVQVSYPNTVIITVEERRAVGYLASGPLYLLIDRTGVQYRDVATRPARLPKLVVPAGTSGAVNSTVAAVATVAADLPAGVLRRVSSIQAMDPDAITLVLRDERVVRWGSAAQSELKARVLPVLLARPYQQYDLTDPARPVAR